MNIIFSKGFIENVEQKTSFKTQTYSIQKIENISSFNRNNNKPNLNPYTMVKSLSPKMKTKRPTNETNRPTTHRSKDRERINEKKRNEATKARSKRIPTHCEVRQK